jgi:hypothetical protein
LHKIVFSIEDVRTGLNCFKQAPLSKESYFNLNRGLNILRNTYSRNEVMRSPQILEEGRYFRRNSLQPPQKRYPLTNARAGVRFPALSALRRDRGS